MTIVDARGQKCPLPVLRMEKALMDMKPGDALAVLATDPVARIDVVLYCRQNGHSVTMSETEGSLRFDIVCRGADNNMN